MKCQSLVKDRTGTTHGKWTYLRREPSKKHSSGHVVWVKQCECGTIKTGIFLPGSKSCGCSRGIGSTHVAWKGGRRLKGGYILIYRPDHPRASKRNGYVAEHILVMEKHLNRFLLKTEIVHHINGERTDNKVENLELWDYGHPHGQRHTDKMRFYMSELLKKCDRRILAQFCKEVLE